MLTRVYPPNTWPKFYPELTPELDFKITIIIIFVIMLTWVNSQPNLWLEACQDQSPNRVLKL
jgi:hypothetical protein